MTMKRIAILAIAAGALLAPAAGAQELLKIATGKPDATNSQMMKAIINACPNLVEEDTDTTGGADNVGKLVANQVHGGIAQVDVVQFLEKTEPAISKLKSLVALNPNYLHVIAATKGFVVEPAQKGTLGFGGKPEVRGKITKFTDLNNRTVAANGSAQLTLRVIADKLNLNINIVDADDRKAGLDMLANGQVAAFVAMGGKPVEWVGKLDGSVFELVPVGQDIAEKLGAPYSAQKLTYKNLNAFGFATVSVKNELIVRDYKGAKGAQLQQLRDCFVANVDAIRETTGTHPAWQEVEDLTTTQWATYTGEAKAVPASAPAPAAKPVKGKS